MKPRRAIGLLAATVLLACAGAWLTPQQQYPALLPTSLDHVSPSTLFAPGR